MTDYKCPKCDPEKRYIYKITANRDGITVTPILIVKETPKTFKISGKTFRSVINKDEMRRITMPFRGTHEMFSYDDSERSITDVKEEAVKFWTRKLDEAEKVLFKISKPASRGKS
jgi:hypothetical protein